jgi:hypothetical protein
LGAPFVALMSFRELSRLWLREQLMNSSLVQEERRTERREQAE